MEPGISGAIRALQDDVTPPTVVISLDLELSWGSFDRRWGPELKEMARWTHDIGVPTLLTRLTENGLSASWAVVGAMMRRFLPDVSGIPEVHYPHFQKPWFEYVPKIGDESTCPEWFGASLVEMIRNASPRQEIGFHSFSHVLFGWPGMSKERAVAEYRACAEIAHEMDLPLSSFVFPRNSVGYLNELRNAGFTCFRDIDKTRVRFPSSDLNSIAAIFRDVFAFEPRMVEPYFKDGLIAIPGSLMVRFAGGWRKLIPDVSRSRRLRKGLDAVRRKGGVFHVWFHPENLYPGRPRLENVLAGFFEELGDLVDRGEIRCMTMGNVARESVASAALRNSSN